MQIAASRMMSVAPRLWDMISGLLDANPARRRITDLAEVPGAAIDLNAMDVDQERSSKRNASERSRRNHELTDEQWRILADIHHVLKIYKTATVWFSQYSVCAIATVIPTMDRIDELLADAPSKELHPAVKAATQFGKQVMNRYYAKTDLSDIYRVAMVLHPGTKLDYFKKHDWQADWIQGAKNLIRRVFDVYISAANAARSSESNARTASGTSNTPDTGFDALSEHDDFSFFSNISVAPQQERDALDEYLAAPTVSTSSPLTWWADNAVAYPILSRMARDYLSAPGMLLFNS
ncbi:hypothetical protein HGRIS_014954 [Hohenbuehelia grisea]|uniref:HAT C-terminal dimerisation domain-containing protein n=1 Tax=Hohenbuehelia grisea TaxID=104357 RepID=A0ABR3J5Q8_9AGAR